MQDSRRRRWILIAPPLLAMLACVAGLWVTPLGVLPQRALAQARWQAQQLHHYRMTASLSQGWILNGPWTVEVRDERVIGGFDTATGAPLDGVRLRVAQRVLPISTLFAALDDNLNRPPLTSTRALVTRLARMAPPLRDTLDHCAARMPNVAYDPTRGYPSGITVYASPCYPGDSWTVLITELTPLP
jgi:uncharacterized protein DUF6174